MPIRPEFRHFYRGRAWRETRERILARAGNQCEKCGVPNGKIVLRAYSWWTPATLPATVFKMKGSLNGTTIIMLPWRCPGVIEPRIACFLAESCRWVGIVLTIAHVNNTPGDDRDENLLALCQYCHLTMDKRFHHQTRAARKDAARPILAAQEVA